MNSKYLLEYIYYENFDHVVVSGDITENGDSASFELARNLFKKYGLLNANRLTVTIGNHDIYGGVHLAEDIINYPKRCMSTSFTRKVNEFVYYFREAFENTRQIQGNVFPVLKELDEITIIIFNTNTAYSYLKNPFASNGKISKLQIKNAHKLINCKNTGTNLIALTHHHFNRSEVNPDPQGGAIWQAIEKQTMKLKGKKKIISEFNKMNISAVLHGHLHENIEYCRKNLKFLNAGGSVLGKNHLYINSITLNGNKILTEKIQLKKPAASENNNQISKLFFNNMYEQTLKFSHN